MNYTKVGVFLDRDGTINVAPPYGGYVMRWADFHFAPGAVDALARLKQAGCRLIMVSNQSCISKEMVTAEAVDDLHERMQAELRRAGAELDLVQYCPSGDNDDPMRKPNPGMIRRGLDLYDLDAAQSVMIGDSPRDITAGQAAGVRTVLVTDYCHAHILDDALATQPDHVCRNLPEAAEWILAEAYVG